MPVFDSYSKRQKRLRSENPDILQYDDFSEPFRVQVIHILRDAIGEPRSRSSQAPEVFQNIHDTLSREYGCFYLSDEAEYGSYDSAVFNFFQTTTDPEKVLDLIELSFRIVSGLRGTWYTDHTRVKITPEEAIEELNTRFLEHDIGFQFESDEIIRMDSRLIHSEVIKPALFVLREEIYNGANDEFLKAYEHYRHGRIKECLNECLKSFESILKAICAKRGWQFAESDTAKKLIAICFDNKLIPPYLETQFSSLRSVLESGVPTVRNRLSGHGQGSQQIAVPRYMAEYALHLTATSILFLANAEKELK